MTQAPSTAVRRRYLDAARAATRGDLATFDALVAESFLWHGPHPINDLAGRAAWASGFLDPLRLAMPDVERVDDILMAGTFADAGWIASTGHYVGTFVRDWLGIPATHGAVTLRYGEFVRFDGDQVVEAYVILDIVDLMRQAGVDTLPRWLGARDRVPGPITHDGLLLDAADAAESARSLALVEAMIGGLMQYDGRTLESMAMERFWDPVRMMWYGPGGIGTARGLKGFQDCHQRPFLHAFPDRRGGNHKCRIGEGAYVASTGWPSVRATHLGDGWLGVKAIRRPISMRVMDFWRREGDLLLENWVFIDIPELLLQMGVDLFAGLPRGRQ